MLVKLISSEGDVFTVDRKALSMSTVLNNMLMHYDEDSEVEPVPLKNISTSTLAKILDYCRFHVDNPAKPIPKPLRTNKLSDVVSQWDLQFVDVDKEVLFDIMMAENFLDIKPLLELTCAKIASMIKGKTPEEIRDEFNIVNDFTPEEEAMIKEENKWCEEL
ncbi:skp1/btb/poz domain superfamily like protein [Babesia gibsoni]|uniref:Skp1/btb/poz domain superfamily like protein n=1 Tax=Babesia gibsoni TaxID=33632 RepID=A0AAD8LLY1_BABGI|nr:skp1/btb/poz domain superfamily like protein [Babesia gibsoni]